MTVQSETSKVIYSGNGSTTVFSTVFSFFSNTDVKVVLTNTSNVETLLSVGTHYTITGAGGASGNITMITAPASGEKLTIYRDPPITQSTDYINGDPFDAETHERALDKLTQIVQAINEIVARTIRIPISSPASPQITPEPNKAIGWNSAGDALVNLAVAGGALLGSQDIVGWLRASQYLASRSPDGTKQAVIRCANDALVIEYQNDNGSVILPLRLPTTAGANRTVLVNDGNGTLRYDNPFKPAFYARRTTTQNIGNATITKLQCNTEEFDRDGYYDHVTNFRFTPLVAGWYQITMSADFIDAGTAAQGAVLYLYKNGVSDFTVSDAQYDNGNAGLSGTTMIYFNGTTDYIEIFGWIGGTGANTVSNARFSGFFIGNF